MNLQTESKFHRFLRRNGLALLLTAGIFALMYAVVLCFRTAGEDTQFDYLSHALLALQLTPQRMVRSFYNGSNRLWHVCVKLLTMCGVTNFWIAAALVTAAAQAAAYFLVYKTWDAALEEKTPRWLPALLLAALFLVNSLTLPGGLVHLTKEYTRGAVNTWHNPTNIMVRPFAAAVFYMTVRIYNRRRYDSHTLIPGDGRAFSFSGGFFAQFRQKVFTPWELVLYPLCLLFSVYAKPSFIQFFAPAIFLFLVIDVIRTRGKLLPFCIKLALAFLPAVLIFAVQYLFYFSGVGESAAAAAAAQETASDAIVMYYIQPSFTGLGNFLTVSGLAWLQVLCICAFPLFIFFADLRRSRHDAAFGLGFMGVLVSRLESLLLHETGDRAADGNFLWGYYLSLWLLWSVALGRFAQLLAEKDRDTRLSRWGGAVLLLWHLIAGIIYVIFVLKTGDYAY